jgi:hypothetical protein
MNDLIFQGSEENASRTKSGSSLPGRCNECKSKKVVLQRAAVNSSPNAMPYTMHEILHSPGQPLDPATRGFMEPRFDHEFSQVRVHTDKKAAELAQAVNARAYTVGRNIVFGGGLYQPRTDVGKRLLAHELIHVMKQRYTAVSKTPMVAADPSDSAFESEADLIAEEVLTDSLHHSHISPRVTSIQREASGRCSTGAGIRNCTDEDLLTAICIGEAGNINDSPGKQGVMNVVMNRLSNGGFGTNIRAIVSARGQFGGLNTGINQLNNPAFAECRTLAQGMLANTGNDPTNGALFFNQSCSKPCEQYCTVYLGDGTSPAHYFARRASASERSNCMNRRINPSRRNRYCCDSPRQRVYILPEMEINVTQTEEAQEQNAAEAGRE